MKLLLWLLPVCIATTTTTTASARRERFPSIEQRIQLYMSNWYAPPCSSLDRFPFQTSHDQQELTVANTTFGSDVKADQAFWVHDDLMLDCARTEQDVQYDLQHGMTLSPKVHFRQNMRMYCHDVLEMMDLLHHMQQPKLPLILQFGDMKTSHGIGYLQLPHFKKFRSATNTNGDLPIVLQRDCYSRSSRRSLATVHSSSLLQPIIWKLATHRHYRNLIRVYRHDTEWDHKYPYAVWRGQLTGTINAVDSQISELEHCMTLHRCRLVYESHNSTLIQAKLTATRDKVPSILNGVNMIGPTVTIRELMRNKALIMLEGNDVASGLKWALLSQSVVLMSPPKHTSWAMEELLIPWVHYIPLKEDATDANDKMQWVLDHDDEARRISERATLWMEDLCFHPDAEQDDRLIMEDMLRRYAAHLVEA